MSVSTFSPAWYAVIPVILLYFIIVPERSSSLLTSSFSSSSSSSSGYRRACSSDDDCPPRLSCQFGYHGCTTGKCDCQRPFEKFVAGRCVRAKLGNAECTSDDECPSGMTCHAIRPNRKCTCPGDRTMTSDGLHCLAENEKALGERCDPDRDACFQRVGDTYTSMNVQCSRDTWLCTCDAVARDEFSCASYRIDEWGCEQIYDCEGGAVCRGGRCRCPYTFRRWGNRCVRSNALLDVGIGGSCDEINETSYCSHGLVCDRCPSFRPGGDDDDDDGGNDHAWNDERLDSPRSSSSSSKAGSHQKVCLKPLIAGIHLHSTASPVEPMLVLYLTCHVLYFLYS